MVDEAKNVFFRSKIEEHKMIPRNCGQLLGP